MLSKCKEGTYYVAVKGKYDGNEIKLKEPLEIGGSKYFVKMRFTEEEFNRQVADAAAKASVGDVEIEFIEEESAKEKQLDAFRKARGIWKDRSDVDAAFKEIEERWRQWRKRPKESV